MIVWHCDPTAPFGERVVQVAVSALAAGTLSESKRLDVYKLFTACNYPEDISTVRTSCGIFVRAAMFWAGRATGPATPKIAKGLVGHPSWVDLATSDAAFRPAALAPSSAVPGAVFWKSSPDHVGLLLRELAPGVWATAEGGGGAGTECRISWRALDASFPHLQGIWVPDEMGLVGSPPTPTPPAPALPGSRPTLRPGSSDTEAVKLLQTALNAKGAKPPLDVDGAFGPLTFAAVTAFQSAHLFPYHPYLPGVVGPDTWAALEDTVS